MEFSVLINLISKLYFKRGYRESELPRWLSGKKYLPAQKTQNMLLQSLQQKDSLEEEMATHSNILTWRIPWTEEPDGIQSIGVGKGWTQLHTKWKTSC